MPRPLKRPAAVCQNPQPMLDDRQADALRAANHALTTGQQREARRFASIELRVSDPRTSRWEVAAISAVASTAALLVLGLWLF
ncbi:MAG: hypothetical protein KIT72_00470 [Polyangiaceae bacterium]|nr:hypothetical protein [Polyangiaceae bacterium]